MSITYITVKELIAALKEYPDDMRVATLRHPDWRIAGPVEFDSVEYLQTLGVRESWDVFIPDMEAPPQQVVLVLGAIDVICLLEDE